MLSLLVMIIIPITGKTDVIESESYQKDIEKIARNETNIQGNCLIDFEMLFLNDVNIYKSKQKFIRDKKFLCKIYKFSRKLTAL